jgi:thymidine kinase
MGAARLEVVCGPMFSGKTTTLIARVSEWAIERGGKIAVFKPVTDTRHDESAIISHDGRKIPAKWLERDARDLPRDVDLIALDEAQFFSFDAIPRIIDTLRAGVNVIAAGLDLTYRAEPFGPMPALLALADGVTKLTSRCGKCHQPATRSQRLVSSGDTVLVGGAGTYEPRCVACFDPRGGD